MWLYGIVGNIFWNILQSISPVLNGTVEVSMLPMSKTSMKQSQSTDSKSNGAPSSVLAHHTAAFVYYIIIDCSGMTFIDTVGVKILKQVTRFHSLQCRYRENNFINTSQNSCIYYNGSRKSICISFLCWVTCLWKACYEGHHRLISSPIPDYIIDNVLGCLSFFKQSSTIALGNLTVFL